MSTTYTATAAREDRWWVITVEGIGVTQSRTLRDAAGAARGLICAMLDVDEDTVDVDVHPDLDPAVAEQVRTARERVARLEREQAETAAASRAAARALVERGLSGADTAAVLGVSAQRVSQLLAS